MGICYSVILKDDFDWGYVNTSKEKEKEKFIKEFKKMHKFEPELLAEWSFYMVFDLDKKNPEYFYDMIMKHCDYAWYYDDLNDFIKKLIPDEQTR